MIKENMKKEKNFKTGSFPLSAFLYSKNQHLEGISSSDDPGRKDFSFLQTDRLDELVGKYKFGDRGDPDLLVEVHLYEQARRDLLDILNEN
jgi:hypothetical protein